MWGENQWRSQQAFERLQQRLPKNPRIRCKRCHNRTTKQQAKANGGLCFSCKTALPGPARFA